MTTNKFISPEGLEKLKEELTHRQTVLRRSIADSIGTAKEQGDLSENFEYQDAKDRQAQNEARIIDLRDFIARAIIVEKRDSAEFGIGVGTAFVAKNQAGDDKSFEIVGATEADPMAGKISNDSPIGKAFLGKKVGDTIEVDAPAGTIIYTVVSIT